MPPPPSSSQVAKSVVPAAIAVANLAASSSLCPVTGSRRLLSSRLRLLIVMSLVVALGCQAAAEELFGCGCGPGCGCGCCCSSAAAAGTGPGCRLLPRVVPVPRRATYNPIQKEQALTKIVHINIITDRSFQTNIVLSFSGLEDMA